MPVITADNISKSYADRLLFSGLNFSIEPGDRIGVVGINGTGKSTLLKILAGREKADTGSFIKQRDLRIEYLPQIPNFAEGQSVLEAVFSQPTPAVQVVREYELAQQLAADKPNDTQAQNRLMLAIDKMNAQSAWELEQNARTILTKLGISDFSQKAVDLSGGQQKRVALAAALLQQADLLILDEPTNHLDHIALDWLESYLQQYRGAVIMVTHDRYFLDRVAKVMFELENGHLYRYEANYTAYLERKTEREEMSQAIEQKRQNLLRQELAWVRRGAKARSTKQKARLDRFEELKKREAPIISAKADLFAIDSRIGKETIIADNIGKQYNNTWLFSDFSYIIRRDERLGIVGPNGCGKTTLLRLLAKQLDPDTGSVKHGSTIKLAVFSQNSSVADPEKRVIEVVRDSAEILETNSGSLNASQMLERFLFPPERQWQPVSRLSGGEKRRLQLLTVLMKAPNVLILDEPTNDLDTQTLAVLEDYLDDFAGAVITVSHDRYFLDRTADRLMVFTDQGEIRQIEGSYSENSDLVISLQTKNEDNQAGQQTEAKPIDDQRNGQKRIKNRFSYKEQKEWDTIEQNIAEIDEEINKQKALYNKYSADYVKLQEIQAKLDQLQNEHDELMERWLYLSELQDSFNSVG